MNSYNSFAQQPYSYAPYGYVYPSQDGARQLFNKPAQGQQGQQGQGAQALPPMPSGSQIQTPGAAFPGVEESYIENILRLNLGKMATIYMTFENKQQQVFKGRLEAAGRDHIIISDPQTGMRYLLLMVYLDYITFTEELNYAYPFATPAPQGTTR